MRLLGRVLLPLALLLSADAFSPLGRHVESRNHEHHVTLKDVVCEISTIMQTPIDCETIVVRPEADDMIEVDFEVNGKPANMVFTVGCQETAEAHVKFQALLQPHWQPMSYKERVVDFFAHREWVNQADSTHCNVVSFSYPETEHTSFMQTSCVSGLDCLSFEVQPDGTYSLKGSGIEVHTKVRNENVSFVVEEISKSFDFRAAIIPDGLVPTFHAVDLPGQSTRFPDIANVIVPRMMMKRFSDMRNLLIAGEMDPDNVALWPKPEPVALFAQAVPYISEAKGATSFMDKLCSCPVFETACKTVHVEHGSEEGTMVIKFQHDPDVIKESEIWIPEACSTVWTELSHIASKTEGLREFITKVYHAPSILEDLSSKKCSMFKFDMPFAHYHVHGRCGENGENRDCIHLRPSEEGTTELEISEFTIDIVHNNDAEPPATMRHHVKRSQNESETSINLHIHDAQVHFNVRTANIMESEESVKVDIHIDDGTHVDDTLAEMLAWVERVEIIDYIRSFMWYLRDGTGTHDDDEISLWPWDYPKFSSGELRLLF